MQKHLATVQSYYEQPTRTLLPKRTAKEKICDTFDTPGSKWLSDIAYCCHKRMPTAQPCASRLASLEFGAELLRMGRANHERSAIQDCLYQIGHVAVCLADNEDAPSAAIGATASTRSTLADLLAELARQMVSKVGALLMTGGRSYPDPKYSPAERFEAFVNKRLSAASAAIQKKQLAVPGVMPARILALPGLSKPLYLWLSEKIDQPLAVYRKRGRCQDTFAFETDLRDNGGYCLDTARVLDALGCKYFDDCREKMKGGFAAIARPQRTQEWLREVIDGLPHGLAGSIHVPIWPPTAPAIPQAGPQL